MCLQEVYGLSLDDRKYESLPLLEVRITFIILVDSVIKLLYRI